MDINGIANWVGNWLGQLPSWLFWPAFVVVIVLALFAIVSVEGPIIRNRRVYLGEKKNGKK